MLKKIIRVGLALLISGMFCLQSKAEEKNVYFNDYSKEPDLRKAYKSYGKAEKKDPHNAIEFSYLIQRESYVQEFDVGFTEVKRYAYWRIGLWKGLLIFFEYGDYHKKQIRFYSPSGYLAKSEEGTYKEGDIYHIKLVYNSKKLTGQCMVTDKKTGKLIWDTGEKLCEPLYPKYYIYFGMKSKEGPPDNLIQWDKENQRIHLRSVIGEDYILEGWLDNMKLEVK